MSQNSIIGNAIVNNPATINTVTEVSPDLLLNEIDSRLVKIRPMSTPIDQISRFASNRKAGSMIVDYYSVDTRPSSFFITKLDGVYSGLTPLPHYELQVANGPVPCQVSETLLIPSITFTDKTGNKIMAMLYVVSTSTDKAEVIAVNQPEGSGDLNIGNGVEVVRMGRAATELDVQTPQYQAIPVKSTNFCQIFKAQVEQSTFVKLANKETGWTFSDQEESAVIDMRLGMEKSFLFGTKLRFDDPVKHEEVLLTGGIWNQVSRHWTYKRGGKFTATDIVSMMKEAFTLNAGSSRKILIGGSGFIQKLHTVSEDNYFMSPDRMITKWGIDFTELRTKFGTLYVVLSEVFDLCGHADDAFVLDPEYLTKYTHIPFQAETLNLRNSGQRNTDAIVLTEASCLVLRYPDAHMRIQAVD
ncbi:MAG: DUF5309 domain-containing protein [Muribaculaceae bacterium]|nr:DUF5309 domain-containing protein [Muribaculaceae bacterium]